MIEIIWRRHPILWASTCKSLHVYTHLYTYTNKHPHKHSHYTHTVKNSGVLSAVFSLALWQTPVLWRTGGGVGQNKLCGRTMWPAVKEALKWAVEPISFQGGKSTSHFNLLH